MTTFKLFLLLVPPLVLLIGGSEAANDDREMCKSFWISNRPSQDCSSMGLGEPPRLYQNVLSLQLSNNSIYRIHQLPIQYSELVSIRLDRCKLDRIATEALSTFSQLQELDLSRNELSRLIFPRNLKSLRTLNLSFNKFAYLPDLSQLDNLQLLDVSHNRLLAAPSRLFPFKLQVIRMGSNQLATLAPMAFLNKLEELDVSNNPLECDCSLWNFVSWAESLSLFDSTTLPCARPTEMRRSPIDHRSVCGPMIVDSSTTGTVVSLDDAHKMCCTVAATPAPVFFWQLNGKNISKGIAHRHLSENGRVQYCLEVKKIRLPDLGTYTCVASLAGLNATRDFVVERDKIPIVLNSAEGIMIYCQFTISVFILVCCIVSCCVMRSGSSKTRPQREYYAAKMAEISDAKCEYCDILVDSHGKDCDDWGDGETAALKFYLGNRGGTDYTFVPSLHHEDLCRLSRDSQLTVTPLSDETLQAPLARFDDTESTPSFILSTV